METEADDNQQKPLWLFAELVALHLIYPESATQHKFSRVTLGYILLLRFSAFAHPRIDSCIGKEPGPTRNISGDIWMKV